jgi:uncharacterized protein (TIGR03083 family)
MVSISSLNVSQPAEDVAYISADEAYGLLKVQLERFIALVESLGTDDWSRPTACTQWNVRDMLAHQVGGYASGTGYCEMIRQYSSIPKKGQLPEDAVNELQVGERAGRTPAELIAELCKVGPVAIEKWAYQFRLVKLLAIPHPVPGVLSLRHLMMVIHSRDTWMHRLDICRATGRIFEQTADQDGRIVALVMRDVMSGLRKKLDGHSIVIELSGIAGGKWKIGRGDPTATIQMDALDFNIFASGRFNYSEARDRADVSGDIAIAEKALKNILVLF